LAILFHLATPLGICTGDQRKAFYFQDKENMKWGKLSLFVNYRVNISPEYGPVAGGSEALVWRNL